VLEAKMSTTEERDAQRKRAEQDRLYREAGEKKLRREAMFRRIKDIAWTAVVASVITIIVLTSLGWLTTQGVVERAREEGRKELVALRASICLVRFQQRSDAAAKIAEFKALQFTQRDTAIRKLVTDEGLATMLGEDAPAEGAVDRCAAAISRSV
jgi:hypothetical protein